MVLYTLSDALYLSETDARIRAGEIFFLSDNPQKPVKVPSHPSTPNVCIYVLAKIILTIMNFFMDSEVAGTLLTAKEACPLHVILEEMGYPQPPTPIQVDNLTAFAFANNQIKTKRSKAIDMRFHWFKDGVRQGQFLIYWARGDHIFLSK